VNNNGGATARTKLFTMYEGMTSQATANAPAGKVPELRSILEDLNMQVGRFQQGNELLEKAGHRLRDTNQPKDSEKGKQELSAGGLVGDLKRVVMLLISENNRMENTINKIHEIL
jgi:hypothetical protein